jgi:hypothetical protein
MRSSYLTALLPEGIEPEEGFEPSTFRFRGDSKPKGPRRLGKAAQLDKVCGKLEQACASQNIGQVIGQGSGPDVTTRAADRLARRARTPRPSDRNRMLIVRPAAIGERRGESSPSTKSCPGNVLIPESHPLWLHSGILAADACPGGVDAHAIQPRGGWC